jgi:transposase
VCASRARAARVGGREEVRADQTMTRWLLVMAERLGELGVTRVVMEATSDDGKGASATCWKRPGSRSGW